MFKTKIFDSKKQKNKIFSIISRLIAWGLVGFFCMVIIFILIKSIPGIQYYGFENIIFNDKFNFSNSESKDVSVWIPLSITFLVSFLAILIATPLAIKTASLIKFRIKNKKLKKWLKIIIETTSGIPSLIFGLFASQALGSLVKSIFGFNTSYTIITAIFMLSFMVIPTIVTLTINAYDTVDVNLLPNAISLGTTHSKSIYKVVKRETRGAITIAVIVAFTRAVGETMAISMILDSWDYSNQFDHGFISILKSSLSPLGAVISKGLFSENGSEYSKSLLYFYGFILFVVVLILNGIVMFLTSAKGMNKYPKLREFNKKINSWFATVSNDTIAFFSKVFKSKQQKINADNWSNEIQDYIQLKTSSKYKNYVYSHWKLFWEILFSAIVFSLIIWIFMNILFTGFWVSSIGESTIFQYNRDTTGQATLNTLLVILTTVLISLPIALLVSIFLNEYIKNKKTRNSILFFFDSFGATPSIIFGMFGSIFFIQTLGISMAGTKGESLLAGCLTLGVVILPNLIRNIQQSLSNVPIIVRENAIALGCTKNEVVFKVVLPAAMKGMISATILSIGKILSESAPLYLTAGLSSTNTVALMSPGQTLTTRIYAQLYSSSGSYSVYTMYDAALSALLLVMFLTIMVYVILPYYQVFVAEIKNMIRIHLLLKDHENLKRFKQDFKNKINNSEITVDEQTIQQYNLKPNELKYLYFGIKKIKLKYV